MAKGFQFGVYGGGTGNDKERPSTNACIYATKEEAARAGVELLSRWTMPEGFVVMAVDEEPNYEFPIGLDRPRSIKR